jgi:hypothetical protein
MGAKAKGGLAAAILPKKIAGKAFINHNHLRILCTAVALRLRNGWVQGWKTSLRQRSRTTTMPSIQKF